MEKQEIKYRKRAPVREMQQSVKKIDPVVTPVTALEVVKPKRGRPARVVADFNDDPRSDNMGIYIGQGLSPTESGILAGFSAEQVHELQKSSDTYRRFVENQLIKFKQKHLKVINDKADPKTSQWLLEKTFPHEFAQPKARDNGGEGSNTVIAAIFRTVQREGDQPIPTNYVDITDSQEKEQGHNEGTHSGKSQTSIEPGGANIIG